MHHGREDEDYGEGKRPKHTFALVPMPLNSKEVGFSVTNSWVLGIRKTGKSPKKRGRPRGSCNKKKLFGEASEVSNSMAPSSSGFLQWL